MTFCAAAATARNADTSTVFLTAACVLCIILKIRRRNFVLSTNPHLTLVCMVCHLLVLHFGPLPLFANKTAIYSCNRRVYTALESNKVFFARRKSSTHVFQTRCKEKICLVCGRGNFLHLSGFFYHHHFAVEIFYYKINA